MCVVWGYTYIHTYSTHLIHKITVGLHVCCVGLYIHTYIQHTPYTQDHGMSSCVFCGAIHTYIHTYSYTHTCGHTPYTQDHGMSLCVLCGATHTHTYIHTARTLYTRSWYVYMCVVWARREVTSRGVICLHIFVALHHVFDTGV